MAVTTIKGAEVNRPTTVALTSSVLDHATVVQMPGGFGLRNDEGLWPSYNCLDLLVPTALCPDPTVAKDFTFADWIPGFTFALQGGVQCKAVGLDVNDMKSEVSRVFALTEGKGVEQALLSTRFVVSDPLAVSMSGTTPAWDAPVDLTPVTAVDLKVALALLEGYAASVYAGQPTIHMPRAAASLLGSDKIVWEGDKAYTRLGSKVAIGGGYDTQPADGTWDLYATGEVYVERSEEIAVLSYKLPGDTAPFDDNTVVALAERMFRVGVDCFVAKATGTVYA